jgi:Fur family ferric uptake transcriptional regulator
MSELKISRMTEQRKVILEELRKVKNHPTADKIYQMVRKRLPRISLGTVYRNLEVLASQGEIQKLSIDSERVHFDGNKSKHFHVRCVICGRIDDFSVEPIVSLDEALDKSGYEIMGHKLEFFGKCPSCRKKTETQID